MKLEVAGAAENDELCRFFNRFTVGGMVDFKYKRTSDIFSMYQVQSGEFRTYTLRDPKTNEINAMASFIAKNTIIKGKQVRIAHATDLRVTNSRLAILEWSDHFLPVLSQVKKDMDVQYVFSAINTTETSAINTFIRPRNMRRPLPRYHLYRKFDVVTLHGRFPWAKKPVQSLRIREGNENSWEALTEYLVKRSSYRPFAAVYDAQTLHDKINRFSGMKISDFLIAYDSAEKIVGCVAPWSAQKLQQWCPLSYSLRAHNFRQFLKFGRIFGWTHPLTKPLVSTGVEAPMNFKFLTHLNADNEDILESLFYYAFERASKKEFLAYAHVDNDYRLLPPSTWVSAKIPYALYSILGAQEDPPDFLHPTESLNPEIESAHIF